LTYGDYTCHTAVDSEVVICSITASIKAAVPQPILLSKSASHAVIIWHEGKTVFSLESSTPVGICTQLLACLLWYRVDIKRCSRTADICRPRRTSRHCCKETSCPKVSQAGCFSFTRPVRITFFWRRHIGRGRP